MQNQLVWNKFRMIRILNWDGKLDFMQKCLNRYYELLITIFIKI